MTQNLQKSPLPPTHQMDGEIKQQQKNLQSVGIFDIMLVELCLHLVLTIYSH